jgi:hypothetical protein
VFRRSSYSRHASQRNVERRRRSGPPWRRRACPPHGYSALQRAGILGIASHYGAERRDPRSGVKPLGGLTPSASPINVSDRRHRSMSRYQSALLRANLDTSRPNTRPTCPRATSAVSRAKPDRATAPEPVRPRSSSMTTTRSVGHPSSLALLYALRPSTAAA